MSNPALATGQRIELNDGRIATVRFVGSTSFQTGEWVGVELEDGSGKNDGSVKGERYFECEAGYGMFLRPSGVRQVMEEVQERKAANMKSALGNGAAERSARPSSVHAAVNGLKRQGLADGPGRRASAIAGSPTPGARPGAGSRSAVKSPTKQLGSNGASSTSTSRTNTPPAGKRPPTGTTAPKSRQSLVPPSTTAASGRRASALPGSGISAPSRPSRPSLAAGANTASRDVPARTPSNRSAQLDRPAAGHRMSSTAEEDEGGDGSERSNLLSPKSSESAAASRPEADDDDDEDGHKDGEDDTVRLNFAPPPVPPDPPPQPSRPRRPSSPGAASVHSQRTIRSTTASNRQIEELEAKVRLLERKRQEDREIKNILQQAQQERDQYKGIIEKLQNKYRPQQAELAELKRALSEAETRSTDVEAIQSEHDSVMELATLDREMAEEKAETLQAELDALRVRNEEMELELEILKEENSDLSQEMTPEERSSAGWAQMERSNERLREALLRLRDVMQDKEAEFKEQIASLEQQAKEYDSTKGVFEETKEKLLRSEADTADLRAQLEVALESDEMIEELTDRNQRLEESISQLRITVEELEEMRELNDELEINHVASEKQLQEEIDFKDSLLSDRERMARQQQEALDEADYTLTRYRALVSTMQSDLADMQASKQLSETETQELNSKSRAMLDLNMKLQSSAARTQVKTLDLEMRKLEAQEASDHLAIVQLFLPDAYQEGMRDSVLALLRFKRIGFKAGLVHSFVKERVSSFGTRGQDEDVFAAYDVLDKLTWVSAMAERFVNAIECCSPQDFGGYSSALYELEPVERALNGYVDGLRREEVREREMSEELARSVAVMAHLASLHMQAEDLVGHADEIAMRTLCLQSLLESTSGALGLVRAMVESNVKTSTEDEVDDDESAEAADLQLLLNRSDALISQARSAKVMAGKTHRALVDLQARSLTLEPSCAESFDGVEAIAKQVGTYTREAGSAVQMLLGEEGRNEPFAPSEISAALSRTATVAFQLAAPEAGPFSALATRMRELTDLLANLASLPTDLDNTVEFDRLPAPWVAHANELKYRKLTSIDTETELKRALKSVREKDAVLKEKETELEEQSVRIEMLEARMKDASKRSARIGELERALHDAKDGERRAKHDLSKAREESERAVERVRNEMGRLADERIQGGAGDELCHGAMGAGARLTMKRQERKIVSLEGAVRYLNDENHRLRLPPPDSPLSVRATLDWLHTPLLQPATEKRKRQDALRRDGKDVLHRLCLLAERSQAVDLTKMPSENKLAWRPARETPRWQIEARKEEWEGWKDSRRDVLKKATSARSSYAVQRP